MFPYKIISKEEALNDYLKLRATNPTLGFSREGNRATDYFFQKLRSNTATNKISHSDAWKLHKDKIIANAKKWSKTDNPTSADLRSAIQFQYGSICQFKPINAKFIYKKFKPNVILDISAGWGGRLLGAMSLDIDYIGIDSNKKLKPAYDKMIKLYPSNSNILMVYKKSEDVDYSKLPKYDMIFTSPPYYSLEKYEGMKEYKSNTAFMEEYFVPTIINSYNYLQPNGHLILNMPEAMLTDLLKYFPKKFKKIKMPINNRHNDGVQKFEYIYWIQKK